MKHKSMGQTIGDAMVVELGKREQDGLEGTMAYGKAMQLEPDDAMDYVSAGGRYWDQVSGKQLRAALVIKARAEKMDQTTCSKCLRYRAGGIGQSVGGSSQNTE